MQCLWIFYIICGKVLNLHLFCVISMFVSEKNAYVKDVNALRNLMNFLYIYLGEKRGGCTNACICMETHSQPLLQNRLMDVYETWEG